MSARRASLVAAALVLLLALFQAAVLQGGDQLLDDAYIFFRYVDNWLGGHGLTWNPGGERVEGYTSFLWVLVLAGPRALGAEPVALAHGLNTLLFAALALLALRLVTRAGGGFRPALALGPLWLATSAQLGAAARSGMELVLFLLLALAALYLHLFPPAGARGRVVSGLVFALVVLARPEGLLLYLACAAEELWRGREACDASWGAALRAELPRLAGLLVLLLPHLAWRLAYYGELLPNTFYAKVAFSPANVARGLAGLAQFLGTFRGLVLALALGLWVLAPRTRLGGLLAGLALTWLGYCALYLGLPDWQENYNYTVLLDLVGLLLAGLSVAGLARERAPGWTRGARWAAGLAVLLTVTGNLAGALASRAQRGGWRVTLADEPRQGLTAGFVAIGRKLRELAPPGASVATGACGAIPYLSGLVTIDTLGLNDKHIARQPIRAPGTAPFGHERGDGTYVLAQAPTFVIMLPFPTASPKRGFTGFAQTFRDLSESDEFKRRYEFKAVPLPDGTYFNYFERRD